MRVRVRRSRTVGILVSASTRLRIRAIGARLSVRLRVKVQRPW